MGYIGVGMIGAQQMLAQQQAQQQAQPEPIRLQPTVITVTPPMASLAPLQTSALQSAVAAPGQPVAVRSKSLMPIYLAGAAVLAAGFFLMKKKR